MAWLWGSSPGTSMVPGAKLCPSLLHPHLTSPFTCLPRILLLSQALFLFLFGGVMHELCVHFPGHQIFFNFYLGSYHAIILRNRCPTHEVLRDTLNYEQTAGSVCSHLAIATSIALLHLLSSTGRILLFKKQVRKAKCPLTWLASCCPSIAHIVKAHSV